MIQIKFVVPITSTKTLILHLKPILATWSFLLPQSLRRIGHTLPKSPVGRNSQAKTCETPSGQICFQILAQSFSSIF